MEFIDKKNEILYDEYEVENFKSKLSKFTFDLDKIIPWEESNFVFSGGLLLDIITNRFSQDFMDIDLFFYGPSSSKIKTINKLLNNLEDNQYDYLIGHNCSVIYIFIQGIPRIIQLIITAKENPEKIINDFDIGHLMSYTDGKKIYCSKLTIEYLNAETNIQKKSIKINYIQKYRIIKYIERGFIDIQNLYDENIYLLKYFDSCKYITMKKQIKLYKETYNLTKFNDGKSIDFKKCKESKISSLIRCYFNCKSVIHFKKINDIDLEKYLLQNMDLFDMYEKYLEQEKKNIYDIIIDYEKKTKNNMNILREIVNDEEEDTIIEQDNHNDNKKYLDMLFFKKNKKYSKLYMFEKVNSIYIPCYFIDSSLIEKQAHNNVKTLKFIIDNKLIIDYLKLKLDKQIILNNLKYNSFNKHFKFDNNLNYDLFNIPFELDENKDKLVIKAKLFNKHIEEFDDLNDFNILNCLDSNTKINCLFDIVICVKIDYYKILKIDINLTPKYIHKC